MAFSYRKDSRGWWQDACAIYAATAALIFPLFRLNYLNNWRSIEATFIADARLLRENWPHHLWQPLWYMGTRSGYVYPPGLRYGVAALSWVLHASFAHAYHILIGLIYAFGIAGVYLWVRTGSGSRGAAWLAALGVALVSPCLLVAADLRADSAHLVPWRLHVLMTYGEGPHISSLAVLPIAWLGAWWRFHRGCARWLLLSAAAAALVVTINFYGAVALAITFPILAWSSFLERLEWRVLRDSLVIAALAYGLTAWWLAPSYFHVTLQNLHLVAPPGQASSARLLAFLGVAYAALSMGIRKWKRFSAYAFFTGSTLLFLTLYVFGHRWFGFEIAGDTDRLFPEWDLFAILCGVMLLVRLWNWSGASKVQLALRIGLAALVALCFLPGMKYLRHANVEFPADRQWQSRVEYRTQDWLWRNFPSERVFVSGSIRFWYNVWHDGQQTDGGSLQGAFHPLIESLRWRLLHDIRPEVLRHWLQAMGVDIVVVPGASSAEPYKDFVNVAAYDRALPLLYDDGAGNRYYRVPRRAPGIVRIVDRSKLAAAPAIPSNYESAQIAAYADAVEAAPPGGDDRGRVQDRWRGSDELDIEATSADGEALLVQETFNPYWRACVDGKPERIWRDTAGFMVVDLPAGKHSVRFVFETPLELLVGRVLTIGTIALMLLLVFFRKRA